MKLKKILSLALGVVMTLSVIAVMSVSVFAADNSDAAENQRVTDEQTIAEDVAGKHRGKGGERGGKEKTAEPENALGKQEAKDAAVADADVTVDESVKIKVKLTTLEDGTVVYKVSFTSDGVYRSYKIDVLTGEILDRSEMSAEEHEASKPQRKICTEADPGSEESDKVSLRKHSKGGSDATIAANEENAPFEAGNRHGKGRSDVKTGGSDDENKSFESGIKNGKQTRNQTKIRKTENEDA